MCSPDWPWVGLGSRSRLSRSAGGSWCSGSRLKSRSVPPKPARSSEQALDRRDQRLAAALQQRALLPSARLQPNTPVEVFVELAVQNRGQLAIQRDDVDLFVEARRPGVENWRS